MSKPTDLKRLLNPKTIALFGGRECERVIEQCRKMGYDGAFWPVHPSRKSLCGIPCFKDISELPAGPDAAYVAVNRQATVEIIGKLQQNGAGGAICYAAGFAEVDGEAQLQNDLVKAAGNMPIIGPNCYGYINALDRVALWPDQHGAIAVDRGAAIITQSSNVAINLTMQKRGLSIALMMTAGNQAQTGLSDLALAALEDDRVTALGLHIEGLDDGEKFERLARRARELKKPILVLKVGKSLQAQKAALTHTASLSGSDAAHDAFFKRLGVARVHSLEALLEGLKLHHNGGPLSGNNILSLSCSGGEASLMADAAIGKNIQFRSFVKATIRDLSGQLGPLVNITNPFDYHTFIWGDWPKMETMFATALADGFDLAVLVNDLPRSDRCDSDDWRSALRAFKNAAEKTGVRVAHVTSLAETCDEHLAVENLKHGIPTLCGFDAALEAIAAAAEIGAAWNHKNFAPMNFPSSGTQANETITLNEHNAKSELAKFGLVVPKGVVVETLQEANAAFEGLVAPLALKSLGVDHKTEAGALRLNLNTLADVEEAFAQLSDLSQNFLLEEMGMQSVAEIIVGITRDPKCGLLMTIGAGGVLTELLQDTASLILPTTEVDIRSALDQLKISKILAGYRGQDAVDMKALIANMLCIADYALANIDTLEELDVNPLLAGVTGSVAVDALIVKRI